MIVIQHPAESLATPNRTIRQRLTGEARRSDQLTIEALVVTLLKIMRHVFFDHIAKMPLAKENKMIQTFVLDGFHEALSIGIQVRASPCANMT